MDKVMPSTRNLFKVGDKVTNSVAWKDEQYMDMTPDVRTHTVTEVKDVSHPGTTGQWIKTDLLPDWIDAIYYRKVDTGGQDKKG